MSDRDYTMLASLPVAHITDPRFRHLVLKFIALRVPGRFGSHATAIVKGAAV
ncbi:hypothetical protein D3C77_364220 [compost metagenome]